MSINRKYEIEFAKSYYLSIFFLCYQKDVGSLNHSDEHKPKNKEDLTIARTKNKFGKNKIVLIVALAVFLTACICLLLGIHYGSYGFYKHTTHIFIVTDIAQLI